MGDIKDQEAAEALMTKFYKMRDAVSEYHAGNFTAEQVADAATAYLVTLGYVKVSTPSYKVSE